jgi:plastocyanin
MRAASLSLILLALVAGAWSAVNSVVGAQGRTDPNIIMLDNCSPQDPGFDGFGGCPEGAGAGPGSASYKGNVTVDEFFSLLFSTLAPAGHVIGHPSWRNEPSYLTVRSGQTVRVTNRGGRVHTFTEVADFGGGFVPPLNGGMTPAPECGAGFVPNPSVEFLARGQSQGLTVGPPGLHKFQCCIHPWMRGAIRVE